MTIAFRSFHYPSHVLSTVNKQSKNFATRGNPALAIPPSIFFQTAESSKLPDSKKVSGLNTASTRSNPGGSLLKHDNTIGILGGVSVKSTLNFLNKLVQLSSKDGENCPPFVLCSDPSLSKEILSPERSSSSFYSGKNEGFQMDETPIVENLRSKRVFLENSGARCIVMPCHISHLWHDEVSSGCSVPFLHVGDCVARELKEANLRPIEAGSPLRIGVLATDSILMAGFYQEKLRDEGFEVVLPDKATMEHTIIPAIEALNREDMEGARNLLRIALQVLLVRAVNVVILASDDMCGLLPEDDPLLKKCVDPIDALATSTIRWTQSAEKR